jgi:hypothetical protein
MHDPAHTGGLGRDVRRCHLSASGPRLRIDRVHDHVASSERCRQRRDVECIGNLPVEAGLDPAKVPRDSAHCKATRAQLGDRVGTDEAARPEDPKGKLVHAT